MQANEPTEASIFYNDKKLIVDWTTFFGTQLSQVWAVRLCIASLEISLPKYTVKQMALS